MLSVLILSISSLSNNDEKLAFLQQKNQLISVREQVAAQIRNPANFNIILNSSASGGVNCNKTLQCIRDNTDCALTLSLNDWHPINCLFLPSLPTATVLTSAHIIFDESNASAGFTEDGLPCTSFNPAAPDEVCIFRPVVQWRPMCEAPCMGPQIEVTIEILVASARVKLSTNTAKRKIREVLF